MSKKKLFLSMLLFPICLAYGQRTDTELHEMTQKYRMAQKPAYAAKVAIPYSQNQDPNIKFQDGPMLKMLESIKENSKNISESLSEIKELLQEKKQRDGKAASEVAGTYFKKLEWSLVDEFRKLKLVKQKIDKEIGQQKYNSKVKQYYSSYEDDKKLCENYEKELEKIEKNTTLETILIVKTVLNEESGLPVDSRINLIKSAFDKFQSYKENISSKIEQLGQRIDEREKQGKNP